MQNSVLSRAMLVASIAALFCAGCSANGSQLNPAAGPIAQLQRASLPTTGSSCPPSSTPGWALNPNSISDGDFAGTTPGNYTLNQFLLPGTWQVTLGDVDEEDTTEFPFAGGACSVDLDGHNPGAISETFPTTPYAHYKVKFYFSGNGDGPPNVKKLVVTADGGQAQVYHWHVNNQGTARNGNYVIKHYVFQAAGTTTTLQFASHDAYYSAFGPVVFQISARI